jgi:hypothetical protein
MILNTFTFFHVAISLIATVMRPSNCSDDRRICVKNAVASSIEAVRSAGL